MPENGGGLRTKGPIISKRFIRYGIKYPQIRADSLHLDLIVIVSFQTQSARVKKLNNKKCVAVQLINDARCKGFLTEQAIKTVPSNFSLCFNLYDIHVSHTCARVCRRFLSNATHAFRGPHHHFTRSLLTDAGQEMNISFSTVWYLVCYQLCYKSIYSERYFLQL